MGLCKVGERGGHMTYTIGKAGEYWDGWKVATLDQQRKWHARVMAVFCSVKPTPMCMLGIKWYIVEV